MAKESASTDEEKKKFSNEAVTHLAHLYRAALFLSKKSNEADDLVQETYARAFSSYKQFAPGTNMKAWLTKILYNVFFYEYREKRKWVSRENGSAEREDTSDWQESVLTEHPGPESHILLRELSAKISDVLGKIPEEFRLPIVLIDMGDCSYEEVAEVLSCPVGTIRSRLARGRKLIYKHLKGYVGIKQTSENKNELPRSRSPYYWPG